MPDLDMSWGGDLTVSATGDIAMIDEPILGTQRVLRRLMTNPGEYIWNPNYGAGLAQFVGEPSKPSGIATLVRQQMTMETAVASVPEPFITVVTSGSGQTFLDVRYEDSITATSQTISSTVAS